MSRLNDFFCRMFLRFTGYTYSNLARLFMRLFVGIMFFQFGVRHWANYSELCNSFPTLFDLSPQFCLTLMIVIEIGCSTLIMLGLLMRLSTIPPILTMIAAEYYILHDMLPDVSIYGLDSVEPGYLPIMFIGIYFYLLLAGPGKISLDYMISLNIINRQGRREEEELEEV